MFVFHLRGLEFQSTPVIADGRTLTSAVQSSGCLSFNPHPSSLTGEPVYKDGKKFALNWCFNPHPSSLTGEPLSTIEIEFSIRVSIHTRHR